MNLSTPSSSRLQASGYFHQCDREFTQVEPNSRDRIQEPLPLRGEYNEAENDHRHPLGRTAHGASTCQAFGLIETIGVYLISILSQNK
jgi:hypothetical protein